MSQVVIFKGFMDVLGEVAIAILPLALFFLFFQLLYLKLPRIEVINIVKGVILAFIGIALFLQGVHVGFLPIGELLGQGLIENIGKWIIIPIGFILGVVATFAEPAVRVLNQEVEKVSGGYIPQIVLLTTLSLGVGFSISLAMTRIIYGIPLMYLLLPGYGLALVLIYFSEDNFISIAFDSGGVATGPMTVTFIMAFSVGVASKIKGSDPLVEGFGMIALVALSPILSVLILGLIYSRKEKQVERELEEISKTYSHHSEKR